MEAFKVKMSPVLESDIILHTYSAKFLYDKN